MATWLPFKNGGSGNPHIICPIEMYISNTRKITDAISLLRIAGVSVSFKASSLFVFAVSFSDDFFEAEYPASSTALIISCSEAVPSTPIEFVSKLTEQAVTPSTFETAFSTLALHAAQLIPFTLYCSILSPTS